MVLVTVLDGEEERRTLTKVKVGEDGNLKGAIGVELQGSKVVACARKDGLARQSHKGCHQRSFKYTHHVGK